MAQTPEQRLSHITRHRLRFEAGPLDEAFVNLTDPDFREWLPQRLFMLSLRSISLDALDTIDGRSETKDHLNRIRAQVNNFRGPTQRFSVDSVSEVVRQKPGERKPSLAAVDVTVRFGAAAMNSVLNPVHYVRAAEELRIAKEKQLSIKANTVPEAEKASDLVRFRYMVPHPTSAYQEPMNALRQLVESGVKLQDLNLVDEMRSNFPGSMLPLPERGPRAPQEEADPSEPEGDIAEAS